MADKLKAHALPGTGRIVGRQSLASPAAHSPLEYHVDKKPRSPRNDKGLRVAGKFAGVIEGETFCKRVEKSRHYFRNYGGYAISCAVLERLQSAGVKSILLTEIDSGNINQYRVSLVMFIASGILCGPLTDRQLCLAMKHWRPANDRQQNLFGGGDE